MMSFDKHLLVLTVLVGLIFLISVIGYHFFGAAIYSVTIAMTSILVCALLLEVQRRIRNDLGTQAELAYKQLEAYVALVHFLQPKIPFPDFRGWSASPDFLKIVSEKVSVREPSLIVECGGGTSTIVIAYCLKRIGKGTLITLEHERTHVDRVSAMLRTHGLERWAEVRFAPMVKHRIGNQDWLWYDFDLNTLPGSIDMLIVDGPPHHVQHLARYPAFPLAAPRMSHDWMMIMDDAKRESEKSVVQLWDQRYTNISCRYVDLEKGCYLISPNPDSESDDRR